MEDILRVIGSIARELDSIANVEFKEINLTKGQFLYLARVCENPGIIQGELAELLRVDRTTAARALRKLEDQGLISRQFTADNQKLNAFTQPKRGGPFTPLSSGKTSILTQPPCKVSLKKKLNRFVIYYFGWKKR